MTYNEADIAKRIKSRRRDFLIKIIISIFLILVSALTIVFLPEMTVIFISVAVIILSAIYIIKTLKIYRPFTLFSGEVRGENIKEHEFVVTDRRLTFGARILASRPTAGVRRLKTSTFTGGRTRTKPPTSAIVYLRLENGDVTYIDGLFGAQTDIYEIGDTLYKYPGTRFPIIVNREVKAQPCPLCGTANKVTEERCITCGLRTK